MAAAMDTDCPEMRAEFIVQFEPSNELIVGDIDPGLESEIFERNNVNAEEKPLIFSNKNAEEKPLFLKTENAEEKPLFLKTENAEEKPDVKFERDEKPIVPFDEEEKKPKVKLEDNAGEGTSVLWNIVKDMDIIKKEERWDDADIGGDIVSPEDILEDDNVPPLVHLKKPGSAEPKSKNYQDTVSEDRQKCSSESLNQYTAPVGRFLIKRILTKEKSKQHDSGAIVKSITTAKQIHARYDNSESSSATNVTVDNVSIRKLCDKFCKRKRYMKHHIENHPSIHRFEQENKSVTCSTCDKVFSSELKLGVHKTIIHGITEEDSLHKYSLTDHKKTFHGEQRPTCEKCGKLFQSQNSLSRHINQVHKKDSPLTCTQCGKAWRCKAELERHILTHSDEKNFACNHCGNKYKTKKALETHLKNISERHVCDKCGKELCDKHSLADHKKAFHCEKRTLCEKCGKLFQSQKFLSRHMNNVHDKISITTSCDVCQKVFSDKKLMSKHYARIHNFGKEFICNDCQAVFNNKVNLRNHIEIHHLPPTLECSICSKMLPTDQSLRYHIRLAHGVENRPNDIFCPDCGKCFQYKHSLKMHEIIHTGKKPYVCERCGKCFRTDSNLHQHAQIHLEARPFKCNVCDKGFRIKHHLKQHMATHGMASVPKYGKRGKKHLTTKIND